MSGLTQIITMGKSIRHIWVKELQQTGANWQQFSLKKMLFLAYSCVFVHCLSVFIVNKLMITFLLQFQQLPIASCFIATLCEYLSANQHQFATYMLNLPHMLINC